MSDTKNRLASFHEEVMHDADYTLAEAVAEAKRCLNCKVPQCRKGCPIENEIPQFIHAMPWAISAPLLNISITAVICRLSAAASVREKSSAKATASSAKKLCRLGFDCRNAQHFT
mgnify:CR=1 FL=1